MASLKPSEMIILLNSVLKTGSYIKPIESAKKNGDIEEEKRLINEVSYKWASGLKKKFDIDFDVINPENIPQEGPVCFVANHESYCDILPFFTAVPFECSFVAKDEFRKVPLLGKWIERIRGVYIKRNDARASLKAINEGVEYIKEGFSLVIFPEGTRSRGPVQGEFKTGSFKLATKARAPIVPVSIKGSYKCYEGPGKIARGERFQVYFHPTINIENLSRQEIIDLPKEIENTIKAVL